MSARKPDAYWMAKALKLAEQGRFTTTPNPNVGCVIVKDGKEVGAGYHQKAGTAHAEVHALAQAAEQAIGATAYVTLEPCAHYGKTPPCAEALIKARVARVVCAMKDPNPLVAGKGLAMLEAQGIETEAGLLADEAEKINRGFLYRMRHKTPWLTLKIAASLDGATALANGQSQWITGPEARVDVQHGRAESCAVVTGVGTVLADDPSMNVRLAEYTRQPDRIILDSKGKTPISAKMVSLPGRTYLVLGEQVSKAQVQAYQQAGFEIIQLPLVNARIDLNAFMQWAAKQGYNQCWLECGATLAGAFLQQKWVNEIRYYQAAKFLGSSIRPVVELPLTQLDDAIEIKVQDIRFVGQDIRWLLNPEFT